MSTTAVSSRISRHPSPRRGDAGLPASPLGAPAPVDRAHRRWLWQFGTVVLLASGAWIATVLVGLPTLSLSEPSERSVTLAEWLMLGDSLVTGMGIGAVMFLLARLRAPESDTPATRSAPPSRDAATGLASRLHLEAECADVLDAGGDGALLIVEVHGLDAVSGRWGENETARAFLLLSRRLAGTVDPADLAARYDRTSFAVLVRGEAGPDAAERVGQRIVRAFAEPVLIERREYRFAARIGGAALPGGVTLPVALRRAEKAIDRTRAEDGPTVAFLQAA